MQQAHPMSARERRVILGPMPCKGCGAWVEWDGLPGTLALDSTERHECAPYLEAVVRGGAWVEPRPGLELVPDLQPAEPGWAHWLGWAILAGAALLTALFAGVTAARAALGLL